ncbi:MAG: elongation factor P, partial [Nitrospinae bacterium]|nr:elongation factor P [Nitrospinota bacterium]
RLLGGDRLERVAEILLVLQPDRGDDTGDRCHDVRRVEPSAQTDLEERQVQYLYQDDGQWHFMDTATYEQIFLTAGQLGDEKNYLQENVVISALFHKGQPIGVQLPIFVELTITKTDPGFRGDTATGATKPATLETGFVVQVPLFLNEGERVRIDTRTGEYNERA